MGGCGFGICDLGFAIWDLGFAMFDFGIGKLGNWEIEGLNTIDYTSNNQQPLHSIPRDCRLKTDRPETPYLRKTSIKRNRFTPFPATADCRLKTDRLKTDRLKTDRLETTWLSPLSSTSP